MGRGVVDGVAVDGVEKKHIPFDEGVGCFGGVGGDGGEGRR